VKVEKGRRYLVGAWTRQANTRVLLWIWGRKENGKPLNERLYLFGGYNTCLEPYLRAETKAKLSGEPNSWKLMYRPLDIDSDLRGGTVQVKIGIYMSTGAMTFSHPFMIDITDLQDKTLTVDVSGDKPISRLALSRLGLRDVIWEKRFDAPRKSYREAIRFSDCLRGFDGDPMRPVSGHSLFATYQDGMSQSVTAPQEHSVRVR
jgi:hypothetical protein